MATMTCECGAEVPQLDWPHHRHVLSARARKAKEDQQRRAAQIHPVPRPCEDWGAIVTPGIFHACPGRPLNAADAALEAVRRANQVGPIIEELKAQGWTPPAPAGPTIVRHDELPEGAVVSSDVRADTNVVDLEERRLWPRLRRGKS